MPKSSEHRGNHFRLLCENEWRIGDVLECLDENRDGTRDRIKLVKLTSWDSQLLDSDGKYCAADHPRRGQIGTGGGVITFCESPVGSRVSAFSLTCRDWRKVA